MTSLDIFRVELFGEDQMTITVNRDQKKAINLETDIRHCNYLAFEVPLYESNYHFLSPNGSLTLHAGLKVS